LFAAALLRLILACATLYRFVLVRFGTLMTLFQHVHEDIQAARRKDPAARSVAEILTYAGLWAVISHRIAHKMWSRGWKFPARALSQWTRMWTGIEIHPGATIGRRFLLTTAWAW
jgi:serine acetyltransferase